MQAASSARRFCAKQRPERVQPRQSRRLVSSPGTAAAAAVAVSRSLMAGPRGHLL